jgi:hypothetical protein
MVRGLSWVQADHAPAALRVGTQTRQPRQPPRNRAIEDHPYDLIITNRDILISAERKIDVPLACLGQDTADAFDPRKTYISADQFQNWMREKVVVDLESVPGVGAANKHHFVAGAPPSSCLLLTCLFVATSATDQLEICTIRNAARRHSTNLSHLVSAWRSRHRQHFHAHWQIPLSENKHGVDKGPPGRNVPLSQDYRKHKWMSLCVTPRSILPVLTEM